MKKMIFALCFGLAAMTFIAPSQAEARAYVHLGIGGSYYPYYGGYPYYGYPTYYYAAPPTVVYTPPPSVTYVQPAPQQVIVQQPAQQYEQEEPQAPPPAPRGKKKSQTFTDEQGRTCRHFETTVSGDVVGGTACLQPDGIWRTVDEQ